jgi:hypothetical protein
MKQINTYEFAESFTKMITKLFKECKGVGNWSWGNPAGLTKKLPTYEIKSKYGIVWCTSISWPDSSGNENRKGILVTLPVTKTQSLGQIVEVTIPFEFSRLFNTRAFRDSAIIEIRNYGKFTVGRTGLKKQDFFDYVAKIEPTRLQKDEEGKSYVIVFEYRDNLSLKSFSEQIVSFTLLVDNYKKQYRTGN